MIPVIIASYMRFNLLKQTLDSLRKNSDSKLQIIVVDWSPNDVGEGTETINYLKEQKDITFFHWKKIQATIGQQMTKGVELAKPSKFIYFSGNDMYFLPHWDTILKKALNKYDDIVIVGGRGLHGGDQPRELTSKHKLLITGLQAGFSQMFRRKEWDAEGAFPNYDEDSWICYEMRAVFNKKLGVVEPPVVLHCGLTSTMDPAILVHDRGPIELDKQKYPDILFE